MPHSAQSTFIRHSDDGSTLHIAGDWTLANYARLRQQLASLQPTDTPHTVDLSALNTLDTAGGQLLADLLGPDQLQHLLKQDQQLPDERRALLQRLADIQPEPDPQPATHINPALVLLERIGAKMLLLAGDLRALLGFIGLTLSSLLANLLRPGRWRLTAIAAQIEQTGINAIPIVALLTFMVGAVIAFLGATVLRTFGAEIFTVDLVAFSFLREFGVLLTAILMAGRTASAFTAQIGSMKANEEIDAIRALGLNPLELLVLPRVIALLITLPALTFIAMLCGLLGGAMVCAFSLHVSPTMFISMLQENVDVQHFLLGLAKAPVFAFLIAVIGCMEGFKVSGSAESVGEHTTSSVVQCIFVVILVDALAALFYMEMGW
ncbi:ABC transporter permease [Halopseudomonas maritima]|uniref:ABC transporter permease n=1 Tax=Halopseudomonas maritima TaxID=2918528 RepID=UPI001EE9BA40|nr:MlaE family lipid ABC transporter permease subunit [Halopseudomonas maritima]UJJ32502.1 MlaE family lipid ABC transporter permease subunit [Halopseudomonas maritima]